MLYLLLASKSICDTIFLKSRHGLHLSHLRSHCLKIVHLTLSGDGRGSCWNISYLSTLLNIHAAAGSVLSLGGRGISPTAL